MTSEDIAEVGIDATGSLYVKPKRQSFPSIYRAAMDVRWDPATERLFAPKPREWSYAEWFRQILHAVAQEYQVALLLGPTTGWFDVPAAVRSDIEAGQAS